MPRWSPDSRRTRPIWESASGLTWRSLLDPVSFWQLLGAYEGDRIRLDDWQVAELRDHSRFAVCEKGPQIGYSWLRALDALWECLMFRDAAWGFVSVSEREAREKILYARKAYEGLPLFIQRWVPIISDSSEEISFGESARPSRIMSFAATSSLRGRRMSVLLDEADFYRDGGKEAFRIALGRATRGGRIRIGSTCWGVDTQVDRLMSGEQRNFSRARYPFMVAENPDVLESIEQARQELDAWDFDEEYACVRGGGSDTFAPGLLRAATHDGESQALEDLEADGAYCAGYDVGASGHPAILTILEAAGPHRWRQILIHAAADARGSPLSLPAQERFLTELLEAHPRMLMTVDVNGIGLQIGQALRARFGRRRVVWMQPGSKPSGAPPQDRKAMTLAAKYALEEGDAGTLELLHDIEQWKQFRRTRIQGEKVEQPGSKKKTHYDRYWACVYAWYGVAQAKRRSPYADGEGLIVVGARA